MTLIFKDQSHLIRQAWFFLTKKIRQANFAIDFLHKMVIVWNVFLIGFGCILVFKTASKHLYWSTEGRIRKILRSCVRWLGSLTLTKDSLRDTGNFRFPQLWRAVSPSSRRSYRISGPPEESSNIVLSIVVLFIRNGSLSEKWGTK